MTGRNLLTSAYKERRAALELLFRDTLCRQRGQGDFLARLRPVAPASARRPDQPVELHLAPFPWQDADRSTSEPRKCV
ncbi:MULTISPECIES: hypothetical protein [unclassified Streptomyces]|uniref:hypothetical protein n=1 Tax=unclassified Streptomyces TaxID=2593676 RepID=UPI002DDBFFBC|nr:hypothetical protein [Streptomyces sp. NBC_01750]WSA98068.1 hypothetical protein OIE54_01635 [Streptomyces sp. NBC_01794]WSD37395.1 hypothetical protein OG966_39150 [Streptomyces sp. NBC_01750]